ncbi:HTH-type transcriptional regulator CysL [BD1-7 clade bacterium]|uniref:HTH-type transcriptional regulator CysL n=1 Tax=BD1-7 clade bacterium TaxID=2029982 RepID=A0A5S9QXQ1_9GAMM|nr:HTH-type transcriptional regulator CysL [BD1-7 clade bacterium]
MQTHVDAITLKQLRAFVAIARYENLAQAAEVMFVSRAAMSQTLQELETRLGRPVFDRVRKRLVINDNGRQLLPLASEIIERMQSLNGLFDQQKASVAHLRLGASQTVGSYLLPGQLAKWQLADALPDITIRNTSELVSMVENYELDMAWVEGEVDRPMIQAEPCHSDQMSIICSAGDEPASSVSLSSLADQAWIVREAGSGSRRFFETALLSRLPDAHILLSMNSNEAVLNAVASGLGLGFLSGLSIADALAAGRVAVVDVDETFVRPFYLITHKQRYHSESHARLADLLHLSS